MINIHEFALSCVVPSLHRDVEDVVLNMHLPAVHVCTYMYTKSDGAGQVYDPWTAAVSSLIALTSRNIYTKLIQYSSGC